MVMAKKVAVLAVDPVNGMGLFQYLEAFYENGIPYRVYAVASIAVGRPEPTPAYGSRQTIRWQL